MKNNTFLSFIAFLLLVSVSFISCVLLFSNGISAQELTPETKCYNKKLNASGAYVRCLLQAEVNANRNEGEISEERVERCHQKFENRFMKAEAQAAAKGVVCPSHGGLLPFQKTVQQAAAFINLSSSAKTLTVEIAPEDLASLQAAGQKLNIAIMVGDEAYNVVWRSISDYLENNTYQWSPIYQVFGTNEFQDDVTIQVSTNIVSVGLGQEVILDGTGIIGTANDGGPETGITIINDYGLIHPGLTQQLTDPTGIQASLPIYAAFDGIVMGMAVLTPTNKVLVWFEQNIETGTMFSGARPNSTEVDFTNVSVVTRLYSNGEWTIPDGS